MYSLFIVFLELYFFVCILSIFVLLFGDVERLKKGFAFFSVGLAPYTHKKLDGFFRLSYPPSFSPRSKASICPAVSKDQAIAFVSQRPCSIFPIFFFFDLSFCLFPLSIFLVAVRSPLTLSAFAYWTQPRNCGEDRERFFIRPMDEDNSIPFGISLTARSSVIEDSFP